MARDHEDDDEDFGDEDEGTDADADGQDQFGRLKYIAKCKELAVNPVSQILKYLESDELHVVHYGLGLKATLALCHAMKFNQTLTVVRVTDNSIPDEGLAQLVEVVSERNVITNLDISGNRVGPLTVAALIPFLTNKHCALKNLSLARTRLADKEAYQLALPMEVNTSVRVMDVSNNDLAERSALAFATMLQTNLTLMDLDLSWNKLRAKGAAALAEGLKPNMSLQVLGIAWCGVQDVGAVAFGATFKTNHGLVDVDMSGNGITAVGAEALAGGLTASASLAALNLDNNDVRDKGVAALLAAVTTNSGIVACGIENTNCSNGLRAELEAMLAPRKLAQKQRQAQRVSTGG